MQKADDNDGGLIVRLAESALDIDAAQALRYQVFYDELGAAPSLEARRTRRDADEFDGICDHLLVIDPARSNGKPFIAGTYRMLRRSVAVEKGGFYSAGEFDLSTLLDYPGEIVELGRSCVHADYRSGATMQLLWRGIAEYLSSHDIKMMFGCASFPGTDPEAIKTGLSYLHHYHLAPAEIRPKALQDHYVEMGKLPPAWLDRKAALSELPPLIKGYLRVGGVVGDGAVIDRQFNTTDICVIVECTRITARYHRHYKPSGTF